MSRQQEHQAAFGDIRVIQDTTKVDGLGGEVWAGALVLCEFLKAHQDMVAECDVIELGAGCGLCGLVAAALGAKSVVVTDEYPELLDRNTDINRHIWAAREAADESSPVVSSGELEWGVAEFILPFARKFDTMLGSEITQLGRSLHVPLLETIRSVLRSSTKSVALLSMDPCRDICEGSCNVSKCTTSHFVAAAKQTGFTVTKHPSVRLASLQSVTTLVGALGRPLNVDEDDWSVVFELRFISK